MQWMQDVPDNLVGQSLDTCARRLEGLRWVEPCEDRWAGSTRNLVSMRALGAWDAYVVEPGGRAWVGAAGCVQL